MSVVCQFLKQKLQKLLKTRNRYLFSLGSNWELLLCKRFISIYYKHTSYVPLGTEERKETHEFLTVELGKRYIGKVSTRARPRTTTKWNNDEIELSYHCVPFLSFLNLENCLWSHKWNEMVIWREVYENRMPQLWVTAQKCGAYTG